MEAEMSPVPYRAGIVAAAVLAAILLNPFALALANGMPSVQLWLELDHQTSEPTRLEGLQILACDTSDCSQPTLLDQYGRCDAPGCLDAAPEGPVDQHLQCLGDRCVVVFRYFLTEFTHFQVIAQFSDRQRESGVFSDRLDFRNGWRLTVDDTGLVVSLFVPGPLEGFPFAGSFWRSFVQTLAVELVVAAVALRGFVGARGRRLVLGLAFVALANLISYPVTWTLWPSLGQFQPLENRMTGLFLLLFAGVLTAVIAHLSGRGGTTRLRRAILTLVLLPLASMGMFLCWFMSLYASQGRIAVEGLPAGLVVAFAETFAFAFETLLLYLLARTTVRLSWVQAGAVSLAMNAASFLLSLVL
jgi:hypothetical protein